MAPRLDDDLSDLSFLTDTRKREEAGPFIASVGAGCVHLRLQLLLRVREGAKGGSVTWDLVTRQVTWHVSPALTDCMDRSARRAGPCTAVCGIQRMSPGSCPVTQWLGCM